MAVSIESIRKNVVRYFAARFDYPENIFKDDSNVRTAFPFDDTSWRQLKDHFNRQPWMIKIHVLLNDSDMDEVSTIGEITVKIFTKANEEAAFVDSLPTTTELRARFNGRN